MTIGEIDITGEEAMRIAAHSWFHVSDAHRFLRLILFALLLSAPILGPGVAEAGIAPSLTSSVTSSALATGGNQPVQPLATSKAPTAAFSLSTRNGPLPLKVSFNGSASKAASGRTIVSFTWDFGDGTPKKTGSKTSHTFTTAKLRTVKLTVVDSAGATGSVTHTVDAGNTTPTPVITSPSSAFGFSAGTQITLSGTATDREEGTLSGSHLTWEVVYQHGGVATTLLHAATGSAPKLTIPQPANIATAATSVIVISLTATDGHGLHKTVTRTIKPKLVRLTFVTNPAGAAVRVGEVALTAPASIKTWANSTVRIEAIGGVTATGQPLVFGGWSDSGFAAHSITLPNAGVTVTFTASFSTVNASPSAPIADATVRDSAPNVNLGTATVLSARSSGPKERVYLQFNVAGVSGTVTSAKLYLYALTTSVNTPAVYKTANNWTETGITWANRPAPSGSALIGATGVSAGSWTIFDVTSAVTTNGVISFVIQRDSATTAQFVAREAGDNAPRLIISTSTDGAASGTPPDALVGVAHSSSVVDLSWAAPAADATGYDIERNGAFITTIGPAMSYRDQFLHAATTYSYRLRTRTADGVSDWSAVLNVTTPQLTTDLTWPQKDAASVSEDGTFGSGCDLSTNLQVRGTPGHNIESALQFTVSSLPGPVYNAELRVYVVSISPSGNAPTLSVFGAANWNGGITWATRPLKHPVTPIDTSANPPAGEWVTFSVTQVGSFASTDIAFVLSSDSDSLFCISRSGPTAPQLITIASQAPANPAKAAATANQVAPTATPMPSPASSFPVVDAFEHGLADWTVTGMTVSSDVGADGSSAARSIGAAGPQSPGQPSFADRAFGAPREEIWIAVSFNVVLPPSGTITLVSALSPENRPVAGIVLTENRQLLLVDSVAGNGVNLGTVDSGRWIRLELHIQLLNDAPIAEAWVNDAFAGSIALTTTGADVNAVRIGDAGGTFAFDVAYDDVAVGASCTAACPPASATPTAIATETPTPPESTEPATPETAPTETLTPVIEPEPPTQTPTSEPPPEGSPVAQPVN
jgi:PKD repeat protein